MSYDLDVWSAARPALPDYLPPGRWSASGSSWTHGAGGWQLAVEEPVPVEEEDVPAEVDRSLPGLAFLTEIHLEPFDAPEAARKFAAKVAGAIAKAAHGAVVDEQAVTVDLPRGVKRFRTEPGASVDLLAMSWWWTGNALATAEGLGRFVALLERYVPEALPRRYGLYEPPEFKLEEEGIAHLVEFLHEAGSEFVILYPTLPALGLSLNLQDEAGHGPYGFAAHHLQVDFDRSALEQPGWEAALKRFWKAASRLLGPFYGDVRTLGGYERRGSRLWVPVDAEPHPVDGPFWAGVPRGPVHALVVGPPYLAHWPGARGGSSDASRSVSAESWTGEADALEQLDGVPEALADPRSAGLPPVWPFGD
jgi:hypothetical protein